MKTYSLIGVNPTKITHKGIIDGGKPQKGGDIAEPAVSAGRAIFQDLEHGGLFAFDKKTVVIEDLSGTFSIVDPEGSVIETATPPLPFTLLPNQWLVASTGSEVSCTVRLAGQKIL
jgi:hypothetical protein